MPLINNPAKARILACLSFVSLFFQPAVNAEDSPRSEKDWVVTVKTEEMQRQFDYERSGLRKVCKVTVDYFNEMDKGNIKPYQRVYYRSGKPIGLERTGALELPPAQNLVIKVSTKNDSSTEEHKAVANILWRLSLNITHKTSSLVSAIIPQKSYDEVAQELESLGFGPSRGGGDLSTRAKAVIGLESDPPGQTESFFFY